MATSGSVNFNQTRDEIIQVAFNLLTVYGIGRTVSSEDISLAVSLFNMMIKAWQTDALHIWPKEQAVLYITPYYEKYQIGSESTDAYCTLVSDQVMTQLNGALAASDTAVTVDSTTGMTTGDYIGIVLTDKTIHWTTLTVNSSTTLTLATGVASAASNDAYVYTFTTRINKPLRILQARVVTGIDTRTSSANVTETQIEMISYQDYMKLPSKTSSGPLPNQCLYQARRTNGELYLYPRPTDGAYRIHFIFERMLEDVDNGSDNIDFPSEWIEAVAFQLAMRLGVAFGKEQKMQLGLAPMASAMMDKLLSWDSEITNVSITPDISPC